MYLKDVKVLSVSFLVHLSGWAMEYHSTLSQDIRVPYEVRTGNLQNISENVDA